MLTEHVDHAATLVSTCYVQLLLAGGLIGFIIGALLHPQFWEVVRVHVWWPVSIALIILWHVITQKLLNTYVTDHKRIKRPFVWLFAYVALSAGYCTVCSFSRCFDVLLVVCMHFPEELLGLQFSHSSR
jgi:hypothetical protein